MQVVARHVAQDLRHPGFQFVGLAGGDGADAVRELTRGGRGGAVLARVRRVEVHDSAIRQRGLDPGQVVRHDPVADRARAAAVVAGHAADRGPAGGRHVHREEEPGGGEQAVELVEHDAGFDLDRARFAVEGENPVEVAGGVDHEGAADRLAALRGARAPGQHRHTLLARYGHRRIDVVEAAREDDAEGCDLVDRGVGCVEGAGERVEADVALDVLAEAFSQLACRALPRAHRGLSWVEGKGCR